MPPRKPAGDRIVIPIDTNMLNGFVEIDKIMKNPGLAPQVLANPSQIPNDILTNREPATKEEQLILDKTKAIMFALWKCLTKENSPVDIFISPTVLNELLNTSNQTAKMEFLSFVEKYSVMPPIDESGDVPTIAWQEDAAKLANMYCNPYTYSYFDKESNEIKTVTTKRGPMEWKANPFIILSEDNNSKTPDEDAYVMAFASIIGKPLLTLNAMHFIGYKPEDEYRRLGIKAINRSLSTHFKVIPEPLTPAELYDYCKEHCTTHENPWVIDLKEFINSLGLRFGRLDISFTDRTSKVFEYLKISTTPDVDEDLTV